ncbi:glycosyltransferase [Pseudomonas sp. CAU 1711]|uniref:glycosyltransferase n=1 Tax=Pseudomonas sp. CAU 1711 TaxID=3140356 RepID=UPI003260A213
MKAPAIISLLWAQHAEALRLFVRERGTLTILTVRTQITQGLLDIANEAGCRVLALEELIEGQGAAHSQQQASQFCADFAEYLAGPLWPPALSGEDKQRLRPLIERRLQQDLPSALGLLEACERAREQFQIELLVVSEDVMLMGKTVSLWARQQRIPSLQLAHSIALHEPYTVHSALHTDVLAVYGERGLEGYRDLGIDPARLHVTGNPAWDGYAQLRGQRGQACAVLRNKHQMQSEVPLVVFGTTWAANLTAHCNESIYGDSLLAFIAACENLRQAGLQFYAVIKDRPSNQHFGAQRCIELLHELGASDELYFYTAEDTQLWAVAADVLVAVDSNYSVEAMLAGTATINLLNIGGMLLGPSFEAESGVVEAEARDLAAAIHRLLTDDAFRGRQLEAMRLRAPYYNLGVDGHAAQRVAKLMLELAGPREARRYVWQEYLDVEHTEVEVAYHDTARSPLIEAFAKAPSFVLDIGCAAGANGQLLKQRFPEAKVWGMEINQAAAKQAASKLDHVLVGKFEEFDLEAEGIAKGALDGVILADVLEHMYNPWAVLTELKPFLSRDAQIIISIPNVRNLRLMSALSDGYWEYEPAGLLDITHIRFFTLTEFRRVLFETGYHLQTLQYSLDAQLQDIYAQHREKSSVSLRAGRMTLHDLTQEDLSELCALQFIMRVGVDSKTEDLLGRYAQGAVAVPASVDAGRELSNSERLKRWVAARVPSELQLRQINEYLQQHAGGPLFGIVILDLQGDAERLTRTIRSLGLDRNAYATLKMRVLSVAAVPASHPDNKLHFIQIDGCDYVAALNQAIRDFAVDWFMLVDAGDEFCASGLMVAALELTQAPQCRAIFADELQRQADGELGGAFRPALNLDLLLSFPRAMSKHWLLRREVFIDLGGYDAAYPEAIELDLVLRLIEKGGLAGIGHVAEPLLYTDAPALQENPGEQAAIQRHLTARGYTAEVISHLPARYRIRYGHPDKPLVSIIIPTKDQLPILQRCVESLLEKTSYSRYELLIVDNASQTSEAKAWLEAVEHMGEDKVRVLRYPHPFNYSAINNMAVSAARGEYLVLLNNDTAIISEAWLDELLNHALRPEVGIVGAKLLYPDGKVQHAGVVLGLRGPADHPFIDEPIDAPGYMQRLQVEQDYSAVTAACLMIRKSIYEQVGGLDEDRFKVSYNDVDLCLKVREAGYLIVWTPHSVVMHEGSVSQRRIDPKAQEEKRRRFVEEQDAMYAKWLPALANDPAYNRNLSLNGRGFELEPDVQLSWRPLTWRPLPVILAHPADPWGCGNYRVIQPFQALRERGNVDGMLSPGLLQVVDLERYDPDVIVLQRQIGDERLEAMRRIKAFSRAFKLYELDDYLPNLPMKSIHREHMPKDVLRSLRRGLGYVDRFVVSTEALAEALEGLHAEIHVVHNRLPTQWWGGLVSRRRRGSKPRVGWAGGGSHTGDLQLIIDVVKELCAEVDWVFFGMCPPELAPYVKENIPGVDIELYPQALARLDLDLAIAPVEQNLFNECKSNLRLLEYGACGFPVVCSDVRCYRGDLPVTRVKNRFKEWVEAIRMHIHDLDATAKLGDELRQRVLSEWMLEGENLELWRQAWLPK